MMMMAAVPNIASKVNRNLVNSIQFVYCPTFGESPLQTFFNLTRYLQSNLSI
jgi:hypothetical protein